MMNKSNDKNHYLKNLHLYNQFIVNNI
jgi:hypothetical protein